MEIKPLSQSGIDAAGKQMRSYDTNYGPLGYYPEIEWQPTPNILPVGNTQVLIFNVLGVLFYTTAIGIMPEVEYAQDLSRAYSQRRLTSLLRLPGVRTSLQPGAPGNSPSPYRPAPVPVSAFDGDNTGVLVQFGIAAVGLGAAAGLGAAFGSAIGTSAMSAGSL